MLAALECVQDMVGRVEGSGTCPVKFHSIEPSAGMALLAATLGIAAVPSVHVRFNQGRCVDKPSLLVKVMRSSDESLVINATER